MGSELPTEFRIFTAGAVETTKGTFTFDEEAAASVMAEYAAHGIDLMIDYDHASLASMSIDPAQAGKAAGWFNIELRDGELWAVNVRWNPPAAAALRNKEWRFMSPAFSVDDSGRVIDLLNVAITNMPATRQLTPLVAASKGRDMRKLSEGPAFAQINMAICAALEALYPRQEGVEQDGPWVTDVFDATAVYQLQGSYYEVSYTFDGSTASLGSDVVKVERTYAPVQEAAPLAASRKTTKRLSRMDPKLIAAALEAIAKGDSKAALEILTSLVASAAGAEPEKPEEKPDAPEAPKPEAPKPEASADKPEEDKPAEVATALSRIMHLSGKASIVAAAAEIATWRESHLKLEVETQKLAAERATMESAERRKGCVDLVALGGRAPSTVWADDKCSGPKKYLASMSIEDFREYVADALKTSKGASSGGSAPTSSGDGSQVFETANGPVTLSASELAECERAKADPKVYAANKALRSKRTTKGSV